MAIWIREVHNGVTPVACLRGAQQHGAGGNGAREEGVDGVEEQIQFGARDAVRE